MTFPKSDTFCLISFLYVCQPNPWILKSSHTKPIILWTVFPFFLYLTVYLFLIWRSSISSYQAQMSPHFLWKKYFPQFLSCSHILSLPLLLPQLCTYARGRLYGMVFRSGVLVSVSLKFELQHLLVMWP